MLSNTAFKTRTRIGKYNVRFTSNTAKDSQLRTSNTLKKPQFDVKSVSTEFNLFKEICAKRNVKFPLSPKFCDDYRELQKINETILNFKHESKKCQNILKKLKVEQKKNDANNLMEQESILDTLTKYKPILKEKSEAATKIEDELNLEVSNLPNYIHPSVGPKQILVKYINPTLEIQSSKEEDFPLKPQEKFDHKDIMEKLGLVNFQQATTISGRGWYYLMGDAALLEQALIQYALKLARANGFKMVLPPSIVKTQVTNACGFKPRDTNNERQVYELVHGDLCLTGTAEIPLAALYADHEFKHDDLPLDVVGLSRSYRAEAGAAGRDTRGLYRVHEFSKVELFSWTHPDEAESMKQFDRLVDFQIKFVESLGLTARVLVMPYNDLGAPAYKKVDIEVMMPGRGAWGEISSTSNCLDYQSRRLNTKVRDLKDKKLKFVHTLNGTAVAAPRVVLAIVENFYNPKTDSITIPDVLRPYMDDKKEITK